MRMPDFLIIGAAKSGTTALFHALKQHPQISMHRQKEPEFFTYEGIMLKNTDPTTARFNRWIITDLEAYLAGFAHADPNTIWGEASTAYLNCYRTQETAANIYKYNPKSRLIAILRHPAERAYSAYNFTHQLGLEMVYDFRQALALEEHRHQQNWHRAYYYRLNGEYAKLLRPYFELFPQDQIKIYLYEEWTDRPGRVLHELFQFLQVDETFVPDYSGRKNQTLLTRNTSLQRFLDRPPGWVSKIVKVMPNNLRKQMKSKIQLMNQKLPAPLDPALRAELVDYFREDILHLQTMLNRDLSHWLK